MDRPRRRSSRGVRRLTGFYRPSRLARLRRAPFSTLHHDALYSLLSNLGRVKRLLLVWMAYPLHGAVVTLL